MKYTEGSGKNEQPILKAVYSKTETKGNSMIIIGIL
jgi:hypothetical protein